MYLYFVFCACEKVFIVLVCGEKGGEISSYPLIGLRLHKLLHEFQELKGIKLTEMKTHDFETLTDGDLHSTQLSKQICLEYIKIRMWTYGKQ